MDLRPGDKIFGFEGNEYTITRFIGSGAFGIVYEIEGLSDEHFALKTIITSSLDDNKLKALINEGQSAMEVEHPNVLKVIYFHDGQKYPKFPPYIIMELASDGTLQDLIDQKKETKQFFTNEELCSIMLNLASGMKAINEKLVHRDIKPDNILIKKGVLKISDFGLSKVVGEATRTQTLKGLINLMYTAPEAWRQKENTIAMDIYSMGLVFYELATLRHPYTVKQVGDNIEAWKNAHLMDIPDDPRKYNGNIDLGLSQLIQKMVSKRPTDRYNSWDEVILRIKSKDSTIKPRQDVSKLVERALETRRIEEMKKSKLESEDKKRKELEGIVECAFNDIVKAVQEIVENFNSTSDIAKLEVDFSEPLIINVFKEGYPDKKVKVLVNVVYKTIKFDGGTVKAWGYVKAPSGLGFNLILKASRAEDIYGSWKTLPFVINSQLVKKSDGRPKPFPLWLSKLPDEFVMLNTIHTYQTTKKEQFTQDLLMPLIEELLVAR